MGITNEASVVSISNTVDGDIKSKIESDNKAEITVSLGKKSQLLQVQARPRIDLILAAPRPLRLERIITVASCLGVNRIAIIGANKVEKHYFGN